VSTVESMASAGARYDDIADFYDAAAGQSVADPATAELLRLSGDVRGMRVLDVACGQGRVARELARRGAQVTGVDISAALLAIAGALETDQPHGISYVHADVTGTDVLAGQEFDGAVCNYGLSDIDDLDGLMATIARLVRPGGWFVLSLLHPCFPGWDPDAPSSWPPELGYFHEGWWLASNPGFRGRVGSQHRMLSTYLNSLAHHRLALDEVAEPAPGPEWARRLPGAAAVPLYLVARCRRAASIQ
jgi:ubiquinone/menaquinone biosynthesis C-methylase UbiE